MSSNTATDTNSGSKPQSDKQDSPSHKSVQVGWAQSEFFQVWVRLARERPAGKSQ
jgi:hypothetical protein